MLRLKSSQAEELNALKHQLAAWKEEERGRWEARLAEAQKKHDKELAAVEEHKRHEQEKVSGAWISIISIPQFYSVFAADSLPFLQVESGISGMTEYERSGRVCFTLCTIS